MSVDARARVVLMLDDIKAGPGKEMDHSFRNIVENLNRCTPEARDSLLRRIEAERSDAFLEFLAEALTDAHSRPISQKSSWPKPVAAASWVSEKTA